MQTSLDRYGRVIIPKEIRDALGLKPGVSLKVEKINQKVVLEQVDEDSFYERRGPTLVFTGEVDNDIVNAVEDERNRRLKDLLDRELR